MAGRTEVRLSVATREEVATAEQAIDAAFGVVPLPATPLDIARWHALTVAEDVMRLWWYVWGQQQLASARPPAFEFLRLADRLKYDLRHLLQRLDRVEPPPLRYQTPHLLPAAVQPTLDYFDTARRYDGLTRAFTAVHAGHSTFLIDPGERQLVSARRDLHDVAFNALEFLLVQATPERPQMPQLSPLSWILEAFDAGLASDIVREIVRDTVVIGSHGVAYTYRPGIGRQMQSALACGASADAADGGIPTDWTFPWGSAATVSRLLTALHIRCAYHVLAVHFGSLRHRVPGIGVPSLCWLIEPATLVREVGALAEVAPAEAEPLLRALVYGHETTAPDIALQPLLPAPPARWLVPPLLTLSGNAERNLLALHARVRPSSFNAQSGKFERDMTDRVVAHVRERFPAMRTGVRLASDARAGEIDLLAADPATRTLLIGELRWMLPPGDASEVVRREAAARAKVPQLRRKVEAVRQQVATALAILGQTTSDAAAWRVVGVVVLEGFAGAWTPDAGELPVVPVAVLRVGLRFAPDLQALHGWLASGTWLPRESDEFLVGTEDIDFGGWRIQVSTLLPGPGAAGWWHRIESQIAAGDTP